MPLVDLKRDEIRLLLGGRDPDPTSQEAADRERARGKLRSALEQGDRREKKLKEEPQRGALVGQTFVEKTWRFDGGDGAGATLVLTKRIEMWGFKATRNGHPWQLTDRALDEYYLPASTKETLPHE